MRYVLGITASSRPTWRAACSVVRHLLDSGDLAYVDHETVPQRKRLPVVAGSGAAHRQRHPVPGGDRDHLGQFVDRVRDRDGFDGGVGELVLQDGAVPGEVPEVLGDALSGRDDSVGAEQPDEPFDGPGVSCGHG
jgi:hypothetical protein